jgi:hypothetical protein
VNLSHLLLHKIDHFLSICKTSLILIHTLHLVRQFYVPTRKRDAKGKIPFAKYAEEYLEEWSKRKKAFSTYERDTYSVKHLKVNFGNREIGGITKRDVGSIKVIHSMMKSICQSARKADCRPKTVWMLC